MLTYVRGRTRALGTPPGNDSLPRSRRREHERPERTAHRMVAELGGQVLGHRCPDAAQRRRLALHDRVVDGIALDEADGRVGGGRAHSDLRYRIALDVAEADLL